MKKAILIPLLVLLAGAAVFGIIQYSSKGTVTVTKQQTTKTDQNQAEGGTFIEIQEVRNESIETELPDNMTEGKVQNVIHQMSHQKVRAEEKWGFIPLTMERVNRLIEVVNANQYEHEGVYLDILKRWKNNNFSHVDTDHNAVWSLQNGTVGKATGILTVEEEQQFIAKYYSIKE
ncbi:DUF6241 domain-containing protein [Niallia sp. XMNu-256]|uniref:DUF6241 domain-containing protein n=1 Tax=Niallia sp. XMNu-256 TaxID=3082444 RepID=UPI0030CE0E40